MRYSRTACSFWFFASLDALSDDMSDEKEPMIVPFMKMPRMIAHIV